jgi:hypothetical protein
VDRLREVGGWWRGRGRRDFVSAEARVALLVNEAMVAVVV